MKHEGGLRDWHQSDVDGPPHDQGEYTMTFQLDAARATIDERLREAEQYRLLHAVRVKDRAERLTRRAHQVLTNLTA
ncbi:hypothetical protein GCM10009665_56640 [Kitasatospora nipponensis]|uniref:Uncharacterized protein n=2 Tax=Kitasatospora nipponensis TaxID=258049 RepID=A0ABN1WPU9_9ACTN